MNDVINSHGADVNKNYDDDKSSSTSKISPLAIFMIILFIMCFVVHFTVNGIRDANAATAEAASSSDITNTNTEEQAQ